MDWNLLYQSVAQKTENEEVIAPWRNVGASFFQQASDLWRLGHVHTSRDFIYAYLLIKLLALSYVQISLKFLDAANITDFLKALFNFSTGSLDV